MERFLGLYSSGTITLQECVNQIRSILAAAPSSDILKTAAAELPPDVLSAIQAEVDQAPASEEEWAGYRLIAGGDWDPAVSIIQIEGALAKSQAQFYRFVTAWRVTFPNDNLR